jgi:hypothetical protein
MRRLLTSLQHFTITKRLSVRRFVSGQSVPCQVRVEEVAFDIIWPAKIDCSVHSSHTAGDQKYAIHLQEDGLPLLPILDINLVSPNDARLMLRAYIELTWSESLKLI